MCEQDSFFARRKIAAYHHLDKIVTSKPGALLIRELLDAFKVTGSAGAIEISSRSLEDSDSHFEGEERAMFLYIIQKMLHWIPEKRPTAKELLEHPWLH